MNIPYIDLKRFEDKFLQSWEKKVQEISVSANFIGGKEISSLESKLSKLTQNNYTITCANGTDAIQIALRSVGVEKNDLVLVPNLTFWSTFEAVVNVGALPITVDADLIDGGICFDSFKKAIHLYKPKAALIAHLYGWGSRNLKEIRRFCKKQEVLLIEDGAQCFATNYLGDSIYKNALISTSSFYPAKVLGAAGDGGAVFTNNKQIAQIARKLSNHGRSDRYGHDYVGWNSRMDSLQASYLLLALKYLPKKIKSRIKAINFYKKKINLDEINFMHSPKEFNENGYCNVILLNSKKNKEKLESILKNNNIGFSNIYPVAMSDQVGAKEFIVDHVGGKNAQKICSSVLNLPIFPYITDEELNRVSETVNSAFIKKNT